MRHWGITVTKWGKAVCATGNCSYRQAQIGCTVLNELYSRATEYGAGRWRVPRAENNNASGLGCLDDGYCSKVIFLSSANLGLRKRIGMSGVAEGGESNW
jgi:hypothetical protein